jgi:hypothetical protein
MKRVSERSAKRYRRRKGPDRGVVGMSWAVVSVAVVTVRSMTSTRSHTCVFFDDGALEVACGCGQRAMYLVEDDDELGATLVVLLEETATVTTLVPTTAARSRELAVSA